MTCMIKPIFEIQFLESEVRDHYREIPPKQLNLGKVFPEGYRNNHR